MHVVGLVDDVDPCVLVHTVGCPGRGGAVTDTRKEEGGRRKEKGERRKEEGGRRKEEGGGIMEVSTVCQYRCSPIYLYSLVRYYKLVF